jgi:hypothetical protein
VLLLPAATRTAATSVFYNTGSGGSSRNGGDSSVELPRQRQHLAHSHERAQRGGVFLEL